MNYRGARRETIQCLEALREHRYYMGKRLDRPVTIGEAYMDWSLNKDITVNGKHLHESQAKRFDEDYAKSEDYINESCDALCGPESCKNLRDDSFQRDAIRLCPYGSDERLERVHSLLRDFDCESLPETAVRPGNEPIFRKA
jgi:hypothetical protein